jgi:hypothetical protein
MEFEVFNRLLRQFEETGTSGKIPGHNAAQGFHQVQNAQLELKAMFLWYRKNRRGESPGFQIINNSNRPISLLICDETARMFYYHEQLAQFQNKGASIHTPNNIGGIELELKIKGIATSNQ